ncbi:MAG: ArnT family glycosyltransferase [Candidatus Binataceae bacterium]
MLAVLPLLSFVLFFAVLRLCDTGVRGRLISASILWGAVLFGITELLSVFHSLDRIGISLAWILVSSLAAGAIWVPSRFNSTVPFTDATSGDVTPRPEAAEVYLLIGVCVILGLIGLTAIVAPPNTWDAVAYHLPRMLMWISNRGVMPFPTLDFIQLTYGPWAEYAMLHFAVLFGTDRLVNLVEWCALLGCSIGGSAIAAELAADRFGQIFAALACVTIPQAVLEASGADNGVVVAAWIVACIYCWIKFSRDQTWYWLLGSAGACGLAILTKGTAYVILPAMMLLVWLSAPRRRSAALLMQLAAYLITVAALNAAPWYRNTLVSGTPLGTGFSEGGPRMQAASGRLSARGVAANMVRNLTLNSAVSEVTDEYVIRAARGSITLIGADPNDPDFLWRSVPAVSSYFKFQMDPPSRDETFAGNPLHLALIGLACLLVLAGKRTRRMVALYAIGLIGAFVLYSALLRWQRGGARLQLPLFVLGCPLIGVVATRYFTRAAGLAIATVLMLGALPFLLSNQLRPLLFASLAPSRLLHHPFDGNIWSRTRTDLYFSDEHQDLQKAYVNAATALRRTGCDDVGVDNSFQHYEYPILAMLNVINGERRVRYTGVYNSTRRFEAVDTRPCAVVCFECAKVPQKWLEYEKIGGRVSIYDQVAVFSRDGQLPNVVKQSNDGQESAAELIAEMKTAKAKIHDLYAQEGWEEAAYQKYLAVRPDHRGGIERGLLATQRPIYDARRVWELTLPLRRNAALGRRVDIAPLIDADEALANFEREIPEAMAEFSSQSKQLQSASPRVGSK